MTRQQLLESGTRLVNHRRISGPILLGLAAGVLLLVPFGPATLLRNTALRTVASLAVIAVYVATSGLGIVLRRGGHGRGSMLLTGAGLIAPIIVAVVATAQPQPDGGCTSCVADTAVFAGPWLLAMLCAPMAIGYWRAGRAIAKGPVT